MTPTVPANDRFDPAKSALFSKGDLLSIPICHIVTVCNRMLTCSPARARHAAPRLPSDRR